MVGKGIDKIFNPAGIAVLGPAQCESDLASLVWANLRCGNYKGKLALIQTEQGLATAKETLASLVREGGGFDLALLTGPWQEFAPLLDACGKGGIAAAIVMSKPPADDGWQSSLLAAVQAAGVRLVGPGSWGVINTTNGLTAALAVKVPLPGGLAVISQSGAVCGLAVETSLKKKMGLSLVLDLGAELDITQADILDFLSTDYRAQAILLHLDEIKTPRAFMSAARAASRIKPLVALDTSLNDERVSDESTLEARAWNEIRDAYFRRAGILRAGSIEDLFDLSDLLKHSLPIRGACLSIVTNSASAGQMAVKSLSRWGLRPQGSRMEAARERAAVTGPQPRLGTVWELPAASPPEEWQKALDAWLMDPKTDAVLALMVPWPGSDTAGIANEIAKVYRINKAGPQKALLCAYLGGEGDPAGSILQRHQIPVFDDPNRAVQAFAQLWRYEQTQKTLQEIPLRTLGRLAVREKQARTILEGALKEGRRTLLFSERVEFLKSYGLPALPCQIATSPETPGEVFRKWGFPVRVKAIARQPHRPDIFQELSLEAAETGSVEKLWSQIRIMAANSGLDLLETMAEPIFPCNETSLWLGWRSHAKWGPILLFGQGGAFPEHLRERAWGLPPLNRLLARVLLEDTEVFRTVTAAGTRPLIYPFLLEELLIRLAQMAVDFPEVEYLDLNPVIISEGLAWISDIKMSLTQSPIIPPGHLMVSPYPNQYEALCQTNSGLKTLLRPIKPEDAPLLEKFFHTLSEETVFNRFFYYLSKLTPEMVVRFTQIDYDREIAILALNPDEWENTIMGVARLAHFARSGLAEFAIVVGDLWQGRGLGKLLMSKLIEIAKERRLDCLIGLSLQRNKAMLELGRKLGFFVEIQQEGQVQLRLKLD